MIVDFHPVSGLSLVEAHDFKGFKLRLRETAEPRPAIDGVVFVDDANVLIEVDAVPRLTGSPDDEAWLAGYRQMIDYAASKGWIDPASNAIRAHVERLP
jgi:hypothetical protein